MTFLLTFVCWLIFNGRITNQILAVGFVLSLAIHIFTAKFIIPMRDGEGEVQKINHLHRFPLYVRYMVILLWEVIKANILVLRIAISKDLSFEPAIIYFKTDLKERASRVLLANSITLTPGTITVSLDGDRFCVHCLDESLGDGIEDSIFVKQLREMENLKILRS